MASETQIANLALQKLGDEGDINSLTENSRAARAVYACFEAMRDAVLRDHVWDFARTRASLAALVDAPAWGGWTAFEKPADFLRFVEEQAEQQYLLEGNTILAKSAGPLNILYIARITETGRFDALFVEALACRIAWQVALQITGSKSIRKDMWAEYEAALGAAKVTNGREDLPQDISEDSWVTARERGC